METFKKLKEFYWPFKSYFIWSVVFMLLITGITVVYPIILQVTIDEVVLGGKNNWIPYLALGFIAIMIVKGIGTYIHQYTGDLFGITSVYKLRNSLYESCNTYLFAIMIMRKQGI